MRVLFVTWDGAGTITPTVAMISTLRARGHEVFVLGHDSQKQDILEAGGVFNRYPSAPQLNQSKAQPAFDFKMWFEDFNTQAARDVKKEISRLKPDLLLVDCMMGPAMQVARASGIRFVAFVHAAFSAMAAWGEEIASADLAICCSYEAFDKGAAFPKNMTFVGPLREPVTAHGWTRKFPGHPLIVASLSSGHQGSFQPKVLQQVCDALSMLPVEGLVTTGRGIAPEELTATANVSVERSVDHGQTFPEAALFITHCGHGSIMAALHAGVPMLCMPPIADQPHNAQLVKELGLGEVLNVMAPAEAIAEAAALMLANGEMRKRAKEFAARETYEPQAVKAVELMEELPLPKNSFWSKLGFGKR